MCPKSLKNTCRAPRATILHEFDDRRAGELYNRHHHGGLQFGRDVYDNGTEHGLALTPVGTSGQALGQVTLNLTLDPANDLSEVPHTETSRPNE